MARFTLALSLALLAACGDDDSATPPTPDAGAATGPTYVLGAVVIADSGRTTYVQALDGVPTGHVSNAHAIEIPGNGVMLVHGRDVFVGLAEEPTWVKYHVAADHTMKETGRVSFANFGLAAIDYGNAIVDATTAVSVASAQHLAIVWNPRDMTITGTIPMPQLAAEGFDAEVWTTVAHDGKVYVPGRWADWTHGVIRPMVQLSILDPATLSVVAVAEDDRCASGGRPTFAPDGTAYVMGDGRTYSIQMYANARGETPPSNCLLRLRPGATDFDPDFFVTIPSLTGGLESITELESPVAGSGVAFAKMFYPDQLPDGVTPTSFDFWSTPSFKMWRLELGDAPTAKVVDGMPFATVGFDGADVGGKLYTGESPDDATSVVYEVDPVANRGVEKFTMDGLFYGFARLDEE